MKIGIIGSGALGSNVARALVKNGYSAVIANKSGPAALTPLLAELGKGITAGTIEQAASADIVVVAVPWSALQPVLGGLPAWNNRIVIDATNPVAFIDPNSPDAKDPSNPLAAYGIKPINLGGKSSSAVFSELVPGARVVKAFNHLDARVLSTPQTAAGTRVFFYSGDDTAARTEVGKLLASLGAFPVDLGTLQVGAPLMQFPFGALAMTNFIKAEAN